MRTFEYFLVFGLHKMAKITPGPLSACAEVLQLAPPTGDLKKILVLYRPQRNEIHMQPGCEKFQVS